ncbi:entericidin A/B family lipoprotein [Alteromonas sp. C1M14]|uniref:entericidin A/B family lipoprotein n=1 Tax=Alteromonas sp. C1M14 TaxID=2841567 RepID=UPI001C097F46|nr:entericidin A/B family lipoprotein [Alteromonas sp. C1M14]MBU2977132.1 entericidin A/B family lipoprotein [Alteromonas sp. C1M14]
MKALASSKRLRVRYMFVLTSFIGGLLGGCATMEGAGKDIQTAGEALEDAAEDNE